MHNNRKAAVGAAVAGQLCVPLHARWDWVFLPPSKEKITNKNLAVARWIEIGRASFFLCRNLQYSFFRDSSLDQSTKLNFVCSAAAAAAKMSPQMASAREKESNLARLLGSGTEHIAPRVISEREGGQEADWVNRLSGHCRIGHFPSRTSRRRKRNQWLPSSSRRWIGGVVGYARLLIRRGLTGRYNCEAVDEQ